MSNDNYEDQETNRLAEIKDALTATESFGRYSARDYRNWRSDVAHLVEQVKQLREQVELERTAARQPQGAYRLTLSRAGQPPAPLVQFMVPVGQTLEWASEVLVSDFYPALALEYVDSPATRRKGWPRE